MEEWKTIKDYEDYEISSWGRVRVREKTQTYYCSFSKKTVTRTKKARMIHTIVTSAPHGRVVVGLYNEKGKKRKYIHRLVAEAFITNKDNHDIINHIDANPTNNSIENLEWCDCRHNVNHAFYLGTRSNKGEKNARHKLKECDIVEIKKLWKTKLYSQTQIGEMFKVSQTCICKIVNNQRWNK